MKRRTGARARRRVDHRAGSTSPVRQAATSTTQTVGLCSICHEPLRAAPKGLSYEIELAGLVAAAQQSNSATLLEAQHWHNIVHHHLWKGHYDSPSAMLKGELGARGLAVPKKSTLNEAAQVALVFGTSVQVGWTLLYLALLYWRAIGKSDFSTVDPGSELIHLPVVGGFEDRPLRECSEEDIRAATRAAKPPRPKPSDLTPADVALQTVLQAGLAKLVGDDGKGSLALKRPGGLLRVRLSLDLDVSKVKGLITLLKHF
jgi:hypothetical protein